HANNNHLTNTKFATAKRSGCANSCNLRYLAQHNVIGFGSHCRSFSESIFSISLPVAVERRQTGSNCNHSLGLVVVASFVVSFVFAPLPGICSCLSCNVLCMLADILSRALLRCFRSFCWSVSIGVMT